LARRSRPWRPGGGALIDVSLREAGAFRCAGGAGMSGDLLVRNAEIHRGLRRDVRIRGRSRFVEIGMALRDWSLCWKLRAAP